MSTSSSLSGSRLSFRQSLALTALVASFATTSAILTYQALRREHRTEQLKREVGEDVEEWERSHENSGEATPATPDEAIEAFKRTERVAKKGRDGEWEYDESLIREQVSCNYLVDLVGYVLIGSSRVTTHSWATSPWPSCERAMSLLSGAVVLAHGVLLCC